jgi:ankyrin repeat protein
MTMSLLSRTTAGLVALAMSLSAGAAAAGPLHDAARAGDRALLAQLLRDGVNIDEQDETGETALFAAALAAEPKIIDQLLVAGADAAITNDRGMSALHAAAFGGDAEALALLVGDGPFAKRVEIDDASNKFGVTPLIVAAEENEGDIVAYLIVLGADKEITERHGYTALTRARYHGHDQIVTILLRSGALCQEIDPVWLAECTKRREAMGLK